jgi:hypothetical protein
VCGQRHHHHHHHHHSPQRREVDRSLRVSDREVDRSLRVSDRERDEVATLLRDHAAEGRLTPAELDQRVEGALTARTGADLDALLADLPARRSERQKRDERHDAFRSVTFLAAAAVLIVGLWLFTGAHGFWPVWILGIVAFRVARRARVRGPHWT